MNSFFASVLNLLLISMYGFNNWCWLRLIVLWIFFRTIPWSSTRYSLLSCKLVTSFSIFPSFFLSGNKWQITIKFIYFFAVLKINLKKLIYFTFFRHSSLWKLRWIAKYLQPIQNEIVGSIWDIAQPYKLFIS